MNNFIIIIAGPITVDMLMSMHDGQECAIIMDEDPKQNGFVMCEPLLNEIELKAITLREIFIVKEPKPKAVHTAVRIHTFKQNMRKHHLLNKRINP